MTRKLLTALITSAALAAPLAAQAQEASSNIVINGDVEQACVIGDPTLVTLSLGDLTGSDGRITPALAGPSTAASTTIDNAWCNAPSTLSLNGAPLALTPAPSYSTPTGFARLVTYDATLSGWPTPLVDRPLNGDAAKTVDADGAHAAQLTLAISALEALDAGGTAPNTTAVLEAGGYEGSVVVSVSVQ